MGARPSDSVRTLLSKHLTRDLAAQVASEPQAGSTGSPQADSTGSPQASE
jgi:hypothetical protein